MIIVLIRTVILYLIVLLTIRIMGKSELSKMSPFQLVIIFMIAELASIPIESSSASLINGVVAIFVLLLLQVLFSMLSIKSEWFKNFISGKPSVLIENGQINEKELRSLRISINDLMEQLRIGNAPSLSDVEYAILEGNGQLSIIPKANKKPVTPEDMQIEKASETMPKVIISDGLLYTHNLSDVGWDEAYLKTQLQALNLKNYEDVFLAFYDEHKKLHVYVSSEDRSKAREVTPCATS